jgi:hypothetical protein
MYKDAKRIEKNGYIVVQKEDHAKSFDTGTGIVGVYEHQLIAEELLDRPLREGEVVHHLDKNRSNNSPENLLVLSNPMHGKLHKWLDKHSIEPTPEQAERIKLGCIRCVTCEKPISFGQTYCSHACNDIDSKRKHKYTHPDKETLEKLVWSKPTGEVAKDFGVSDKAIQKLCNKLEVEKPPVGYWNKVNAGLICPLKVN